MHFIVWLAVGLIAVWPLLRFANGKSLRANHRLLGRGLVVAALVYVLFAAVWGNAFWLSLEAAGVGVYGLFYWLSARYGLIWLATGWMLHPLWDGLLHLVGPGAHVAPGWYVIACISFDVAVAVYILVRLRNARVAKPEIERAGM